MIYFDNAATTLRKPECVAGAMVDALNTLGNSGRGAHEATLDASRMIYGTREKLARLFHISDPLRIAFASNATEALNTAIFGLFQKGDHVITSAREHNSVLRPLYLLEQSGVELTILPADRMGRISYEDLERAIRPQTRGVVLAHASNLTGNTVDLERVSQITKAHQLKLIVDAAQSAGVLPIDVEAQGIDVLCFTGHKGLMGPQGTGGIYVREGLSLRQLKVGGSGFRSFDHAHPSEMPAALEAGTQNGVGIAGLSAALSYLLDIGVSEVQKRERMLADRFVAGIRDLPEIHIYGDLDAEERTGVVSINLGDTDSAMTGDLLWEEAEIAVRTGAHCAPLMHEALGTARQGAVRFSFSWFNTEEEVDKGIDTIQKIAREL